MKIKPFLISLCVSVLALIFLAKPALAFCGFYVAKADTNLYNKASQVIIARDGNRTVLTMANDYQGDVKDFAMVVPVPVVITEEQVNIGEPEILTRLDGFSAPRLVEYFDSNPCVVAYPRSGSTMISPSPEAFREKQQTANALGVTIEEEFTVGEYDILILSAKQSDGLETWLRQNGYQIPQGTSQILQPYIRQNMKFFVAKVNLSEYSNQDFKSLSPLMIAYESPKFMLPIRLGMLNAQGEQDLIVYLLSPKGQIELTNYRTVKVPSNVELPEFVQEEFGKFYQAMFEKTYQNKDKKVAFLEYAWNMANCDPCSARPLNPEELRKAGVFWQNNQRNPRWRRRNRTNVFITRLHIRYSRNTFPEDLQFKETANKQQFQGRYIIRHPFRGEADCDAMEEYKRTLRERQETEAKTLSKLTGWNLYEIRRKINFSQADSTPWWRRLWNK